MSYAGKGEGEPFNLYSITCTALLTTFGHGIIVLFPLSPSAPGAFEPNQSELIYGKLRQVRSHL